MKRIILTAVIVLTALALLAPAPSQADRKHKKNPPGAIPAADGTIYACYEAQKDSREKKGKIRLVSDPSLCKRKETPISFVDAARVQALEDLVNNMLSATCPDGEFLKGFELDGAPICALAGTGSGTTVTLSNGTSIDLDTGNTGSCPPKQLCRVLKGADLTFGDLKLGVITFASTSVWWTVNPKAGIPYEGVDSTTPRSLGQKGGSTHVPGSSTTLIVRTDTGAEFKLGLWSSGKTGVTFTYEPITVGTPCPPGKKCLPPLP